MAVFPNNPRYIQSVFCGAAEAACSIDAEGTQRSRQRGRGAVFNRPRLAHFEYLNDQLGSGSFCTINRRPFAEERET
jgi:hypothetical protein